MNKSVNGKSGKVPKITEAEYAAYVDRLKGLPEEGGNGRQSGGSGNEPRKGE